LPESRDAGPQQNNGTIDPTSTISLDWVE